MAILKVKDKVGLGRLVLKALTDKELKAALLQNPTATLSSYIENLPIGHTIKVVAEERDTSVLVLPYVEDIPTDVHSREIVLREESNEYDHVKHHVEESKRRTGKGSIPPETVEETYAMMIGHW
jgi:hypothetical protein